MMKLCPKIVQKSAKEGMRWHGETPIYMGGEEYPFFGMRCVLEFVGVRQPPPMLKNEAVGDQIEHLLLRYTQG